MDAHHESSSSNATSRLTDIHTRTESVIPPTGSGSSTGTASMTHSRSPEAGPSRSRRTSHEAGSSAMIQDDGGEGVGRVSIPRPASPANIMPKSSTDLPNTDTTGGNVGRADGDAKAISQATGSQSQTDDPGTTNQQTAPARPNTPYLDLATYPTQNLIRLLASLLQQIASANDQLRPEMQDDMDEDSPRPCVPEAEPGATGVDVKEGGNGAGTRTETDGGDDQKNSSTSTTTSGGTIRHAETEPSRSHREHLSESTTTTGTTTPTPGSSHGLYPSPTTALFTDPNSDTCTPNSSTSTSQSQSQTQEPRTHVPQRKASLSPTTGRAEHLFTASKTSLSHSSSLLSFHARHIPSISIEAYLLRILKYCPTTNEVFLGLLVYFDRMSRLGTPGGLGGMMKGGKGFAIDSYNIHRLVIAGVTVASKFFSDVFYTNSRYAKVGGLPVHELNQLELQFLLLNDFRLVIPIDEMQRYGNRLLGYWENKEAEAEAASASATGAGPRAQAGTGGSGVGAPSEDQIKAASEMIKSESGSGSGSGSGSRSKPANTTTKSNPNANPKLNSNAVPRAGTGTGNNSPTSPAEQARQQASTPTDPSEREQREQRPSVPRQSTHPNKGEYNGFQASPAPVRRASFDTPNFNGQGPVTTTTSAATTTPTSTSTPTPTANPIPTATA